MKKVFLLIALCSSFISSYAQTQAEPDKDVVRYQTLGGIQYQMSDFDAAKNSSYYGVSVFATSFVHWNSVHIGANLNWVYNYGIADDQCEGSMLDFGPSVRVDISKSCFINIPVVG